MARVRAAAEGRIFISYRREETAYPAGWLYDRLAEHFGEDQIFKDVDSIELGDDFVAVITDAVGSTNVLLAVIGNEWLTITDEVGRRRLDNPDDFVRLEIEAALSRGVRVIPILVDGARMPRADELPPSLAPLTRRQALELSPTRFASDTSRLLKVLERTLADARPGGADVAARSAPATAPERVEPPSGEPVPGAAVEPRPAPRSRGRLGGRRLLIALGAAAAVTAAVIVAIVVTSGDGSTVFSDDFSNREAGWSDAGDEIHGSHYTNGAYRIYADRKRSEWSRPRSAEAVYPSAPSNIRIAVEARKREGSSGGYGVFCRDDVTRYQGYAFQIWERDVEILKYFEGDPGWETLKQKVESPGVRPADVNKLELACTTDEANEAVHLAVWANDQKLAAATDADDPFLTGTVGLFVSAHRRIDVEFDDFVVERYDASGG